MILFTQQCIQTCVRAADATEGNKLLFTLGTQDFAEPGGGDFPLGTILSLFPSFCHFFHHFLSLFHQSFHHFVTFSHHFLFAGGFVKPAANKEEQARWKAYFKDLRQELCKRVLKCLFNDDGSPNKWWMCFAKKKFLGMELK